MADNAIDLIDDDNDDDVNDDVVAVGIRIPYNLNELKRIFIERYGLRFVQSLEDWFIQVATNPNGSCGYESCGLSARRNGNIHIDLIDLDLLDMNVIRSEIREHWNMYWNRFAYGNLIVDPENITVAQFQAGQSNRRSIADSIYDINRNYNDGDELVPFAQWMNSSIWSIAAHLFRMTFVVYSRSRTERLTVIHHYQPTPLHFSGRVVVYTFSGEYVLPCQYDSSWQCVVFNRNHYDSLAPRFINRNQIHSLLRTLMVPSGMGVFQVPFDPLPLPVEDPLPLPVEEVDDETFAVDDTMDESSPVEVNVDESSPAEVNEVNALVTVNESLPVETNVNGLSTDDHVPAIGANNIGSSNSNNGNDDDDDRKISGDGKSTMPNQVSFYTLLQSMAHQNAVLTEQVSQNQQLLTQIMDTFGSNNNSQAALGHQPASSSISTMTNPTYIDPLTSLAAIGASKPAPSKSSNVCNERSSLAAVSQSSKPAPSTSSNVCNERSSFAVSACQNESLSSYAAVSATMYVPTTSSNLSNQIPFLASASASMSVPTTSSNPAYASASMSVPNTSSNPVGNLRPSDNTDFSHHHDEFSDECSIDDNHPLVQVSSGGTSNTVANAMARVNGTSDDDYINKLVKINGDIYTLYHAVSGRLELSITSVAIHPYITVRYDAHADKITYLAITNNTTGALDMIKTSLDNHAKSVGHPYPSHLCLKRQEFRANSSEHMRLISDVGRKGKKAVPGEDGCIIWEGPCMHNKFGKMVLKRDKWLHPSDKDTCTTMYHVVLPTEELVKFSTAIGPVDLKCYMICQGRCCHKGDEEKGQLSGSERKKLKQEVLDTRKSPLEIAKQHMAKCAKESPLKFVSGNTTGRITSAAQVRKLRFEAKQEKIKEDGVHPTNDMSDCLRTMSNIIAADISTRPDKREDGRDVLKGIVRRCEFVPTCNDPNTPAIAPDIVLHERSMCAFFGELCETHKIVISLDSTGAMVNFKNTDFDGKVLHTMMMLQYRESGITKEQNKLSRTDDFTSIRLSERVSSWNTATAVCRWIKQFVGDVEIAIESVKGIKTTPTIGMVRCDNALQFVTGTIMALRLSNHIDSARGYNNISLILLIQHERRTSGLYRDGISMDIKKSCMLVMSHLEQYSPTAVTICNVHTYLYRRDGYKHMRKKPESLRGYYLEINRLYGNVAHAFMRERSVTRLLIRIAILVAIFEKENIPCMNIGLNTRPVPGHDKTRATNMAHTMHDLVNSAMAVLYDSVNENGDSLISDELRKVGFADRQKFNGSTAIAGEALQMVINTLDFSMTYPVHIDKEKKQATVRRLIMYSPYEFSTDGSWDIEVMPKLIGQFDITVSLPFSGGYVGNPLFAPSLGQKWRKEMNRAGLNSAAISTVAGTAWDRDLSGSNMSLEAYLNDLINRNSRHKASIGNIPSFMMGRWKDTVETAALVSNQVKVHEKKRKRRAAQAEALSVGTIREDDKESVWQRGDKAISGPLKERLKKMVKVLKAAMYEEKDSEDANSYVFDRNTINSMFEVLEYVSTKMNGSNLSKNKFYEWHRGERKNMLPTEFNQLIDGMYDKYVMGQGLECEQTDQCILEGSQRQYKPQQILSKNLETGKYLVKWDDGNTTHEPHEHISDTGVIDIYDWDIDARDKLSRSNRCYPEIVTIRHQLGESMIDLGDANVKWSMRKGDDGFKKKKERGSKKERNLPAIDETVYITFKKAGDVEIGCKIVIIHNMKTENKKRKSK